MTKSQVLEVFERSHAFITPDQVRLELHPSPDRRSLYTYLLRLLRQGLLESNQGGRGRLAYRLTDRGRKRLEYLRRVHR
jgi:DNA-binding PadR family transcriptional regulator